MERYAALQNGTELRFLSKKLFPKLCFIEQIIFLRQTCPPIEGIGGRQGREGGIEGQLKSIDLCAPLCRVLGPIFLRFGENHIFFSFVFYYKKKGNVMKRMPAVREGRHGGRRAP